MSRRPYLTLEALPTRDCPAVLDVSGGLLTFTDSVGEANNLTVAVFGGVYSFKDSATVITLGAGAVAAGWRGGGSHNASGTATPIDSIAIGAGGGVNVVNLRSITDPATVDGGSGTTAVNIGSAAPTVGGTLNGIQASITMNAGADTTLQVSDLTGTSRPNPIVVGATGITGLAPHPITLGGTFTNLRVLGSASSVLTESYVINSPPTTFFRLDTGGGADTVSIEGDVTGDFYLGGGADTLTVLAGVTLTGNVDTGAGTDVVLYGAPTYGDITGMVS